MGARERFARGLVPQVILLLGVLWRLLACQFQEQPQRPIYRGGVTKRTRNIRLQKNDIGAFLVRSVMFALYGLREVVLGAHLIACIWSHKFAFLVWTRAWR